VRIIHCLQIVQYELSCKLKTAILTTIWRWQYNVTWNVICQHWEFCLYFFMCASLPIDIMIGGCFNYHESFIKMSEIALNHVCIPHLPTVVAYHQLITPVLHSQSHIMSQLMKVNSVQDCPFHWALKLMAMPLLRKIWAVTLQILEKRKENLILQPMFWTANMNWVSVIYASFCCWWCCSSESNWNVATQTCCKTLFCWY